MHSHPTGEAPAQSHDLVRHIPAAHSCLLRVLACARRGPQYTGKNVRQRNQTSDIHPRTIKIAFIIALFPEIKSDQATAT